MSVKTDNRITQDVLAELAWDPAVTIADLTVSTDHGRVELKGTADTYGSKLEAEDAAYRVAGVKWVDNDPASLTRLMSSCLRQVSKEEEDVGRAAAKI